MTTIKAINTIATSDTFAQDILSAEYILRHVTPRLRPMTDDDTLKESFLDLMLQFSVTIVDETTHAQSYLLTTDITERAGLDLETVKRHALANVRKNVTCNPLSAVLGYDDPDAEMPLYVVSAGNGYNGAAGAMLCTDKLHALAEHLHSKKLVVLPSSVHEVLAMAADEQIEAEEFNAMIQAINYSHVDVEERLSDHLYIYDAEMNAITM